MGVADVVYYARFEAGFVAIPAENYVDYMTNVMPVPERHIFYLPSRGVEVVCEVRTDVEGGRVLMWSLRPFEAQPEGVEAVLIDENLIDETLEWLKDSDSPQVCDVYEKNLGPLLRFY